MLSDGGVLDRIKRHGLALALALTAGAIFGLVALRLWARDDFWRVTLPGYLTGLGTLALAGVTYRLMRQEAEDRQRLVALQDAAREDAAQAEARKVISLTDHRPVAPYPGDPSPNDREVITIVNAGNEPILDVRLIGAETASSLDLMPQARWFPGAGGRSARFILSGEPYDFHGYWLRLTNEGEPGERIPGVLSIAQRANAVITMTWTDSRGLYWERVGRKRPERRAEPWTPGSEIPDGWS